MIRNILLSALLLALGVTVSAAPAHAQATRTWVSGVGDDANPCSRTAPCKTFAGAIVKTATAGEINCLDPGGFGAVTITKPIAIICQMGTAGVLVSGTNGIVVNTGVGTPGPVYLQGLDIEGLGSGANSVNGISFLGGPALYVKDCIIRGFSTTGINFAPNQATASVLTVDNTIISDQVIGTSTAGGILVAPTGGGTATGVITNTRMVNNLFGLRVQDNATVTVINSVASNNAKNGLLAASTSAAAEIDASDSVSANNGTNGIETSGANALIRIARMSIFGNATGINTSPGGTVTSFSPATNANDGTGAPNGTAVPLQ